MRKVTLVLGFILILLLIPIGALLSGGQTEAPETPMEDAEWEWPNLMVHMDTSPTAPTYVLTIAWTPVHEQDVNVNWRVRAEASSNAKLRLLREGRAQFWWNTMQSVSEIMEGNLDYAISDGGPSELRIAHPGFYLMMAPTVLGNSPIRSIYDIKPGMRYALPVGTPVIALYYEAIFAFAGIDINDMVAVEFGSFPASQEALINRTVDIGLIDPGGIFAQRISSGPSGIHYLGFPSEEDDPEGYARFASVVPTLSFLSNQIGVEESKGVNMIAHINTGYCMGDLDPEITYRLVKWMDENFDRYKGNHWAAPMMGIDVFWDMIEKTFIPVHDGTIRYLREIGRWNDVHDRRQEYNLWLSQQYISAYEKALAEASQKRISVTPSNPEWLRLWDTYKAAIPRYAYMSDEEIETALAEYVR